MNTPDSPVIKTLKKELAFAIIRNEYNLLAPEIQNLSRQLDDLMLPIFKSQLFQTAFSNSITAERL